MTFYAETAWGLRTFYCSTEQMCVQPPQPQTSKVYVNKTSVTPQIVYGVHRHLFGFNLSMNSDGAIYSEDGLLYMVDLSVMMTGDAFEQLTNCTLETNDGFAFVLDTATPYFVEEVGGARLTFKLDDPYVIPENTTQGFNVFCQINPPVQEYSYIEIGFMPTLGTGPINAILVQGANTNWQLEVTPNMHISTVLTN
jgi:hypothetical protein